MWLLNTVIRKTPNYDTALAFDSRLSARSGQSSKAGIPLARLSDVFLVDSRAKSRVRPQPMLRNGTAALAPRNGRPRIPTGLVRWTKRGEYCFIGSIAIMIEENLCLAGHKKGKTIVVRNKFAVVTLAVTTQLTCAIYSQSALAQEEYSEPALEIEAGDDKAALAKAAQNPIANLISLPFQNNTDFGVGPDDDAKNTLNIQPVYPVRLNDNWNLITRTIFPVVSVPASTPDGDRTNGLADTTFTGFFSPSAPSKLTWGVGPFFLLPTATDEDLGGNWGAGASAVLLTMPGNWVIGSLFSNIWSTCQGIACRIMLR